MADEHQAKADQPTAPTAAEPTPLEPTPMEPTAPEPIHQSPDEIDFDRVDGEEYQRLVNNMHETDDSASLAQAAEPETHPAEPAPTEEQAPKPGEAPKPAEAPQPAEPKPDDDDLTIGKKGFRPRLDALPDVEKEAIALRKQLSASGQDVSLKDCIARVEAKYGVAEAAPEAKPVGPTSEEIKAAIEELKAKRKVAAVSLDLATMTEIEEQIDAKRDELETVMQREFDARAQAQTEEQRRQAEMADALEQSKVQARTSYPDFADPNSAISKKWEEIFERLEASGDPLVESVHAPLTIALMAAAELGISPGSPAAAVAPKPTPSPSPTPPQPKPRPVQPAPGSARSATPPNPTGQIETQIDGIKSMDDYERMKSIALGES